MPKLTLARFVFNKFHSTSASQHLFQDVIEINRPPLPVYQTVIEKTRQLAVRTQALGVTVARATQPTVPSAPPIGKPDPRDPVVAVH